MENFYTTRVFIQLKRVIVVLFGLGLLFGNTPFLYLATAFGLLILFDAFSFLFATATAATEISTSTVMRGDTIEITSDIKLRGGFGIAKFLITLPSEFEIVAGTNYRVMPVFYRMSSVHNSITLKCRKRGEYSIPQPRIEMASIWGEFGKITMPVGTPFTIKVRPQQHLIKRLKEIKTKARKPYPENSIISLGIRSNIFKELREYQPGDSMRRINWHASAKALSAGTVRRPLVNEYEVEGKKVVWVFIDNSALAAVGTDIENVFEYFLDGALSTISYFISRGYAVGVSIFASNILIRPDTGAGQISKVLREFLRAEYVTQKLDLVRAIESVKPFLAAERPLCFIFTRPEANIDETRAAIRRLPVILGRYSRAYLVAIDWTSFHPKRSIYD